ncbi:MAG: hypothetical protein GWO38_31365, partial [Phycisphaerae bacterium]|nr:hypothetical protein [Phycisphaerae bacterium]NIX32003.1 hypothetical protein [Phycisphaerae bacterium]
QEELEQLQAEEIRSRAETALSRLDEREKLLRAAAEKADENDLKIIETNLASIRTQKQALSQRLGLDIDVPDVPITRTVEPQTTARVVRGGTPLGDQIGLEEGEVADVEFTRDENNQLVAKSISKFGGGDTNVEVSVDAGNKEFQKDLSGVQTGFLERTIERGENALALDAPLEQLSLLAQQSDFSTGAATPALTFVQALANDLNVDVENIAKSMGIDAGNLGNK